MVQHCLKTHLSKYLFCYLYLLIYLAKWPFVRLKLTFTLYSQAHNLRLWVEWDVLSLDLMSNIYSLGLGILPSWNNYDETFKHFSPSLNAILIWHAIEKCYWIIFNLLSVTNFLFIWWLIYFRWESFKIRIDKQLTRDFMKLLRRLIKLSEFTCWI